jgi:bla regulator protein blaR1
MTAVGFLSPIANHLWQSTLVAAIAAVLALVLRKNDARVRYWIWLMPSFKLLVPFSFLIALGGLIRWPSARMSEPSRLPAILDEVTQPFALPPNHIGPSIRTLDGSRLDSYIQESLALVWLLGCAAVLLVWLRQWQSVRKILCNSTEVTCGRHIEMMRRLQRAMRVNGSLRLFTSSARVGPWVIGVFHPIVLLPDAIEEQLTDAELEAILAHELSHVRRRDNLFSTVHRIVEAVFWFYPPVWWIGRRQIAERERACDEAVLRTGNNPETYAEGILKVCELYVKTPVAYASAVSGSSLQKRIEAIVARDASRDLNTAKRLVLAAAGILAVAAPVAIGMARAPEIGSQSGSTPLSFDVVSVKPNMSGDRRTVGVRILPAGNVTATNVTLWDLIVSAYWIPNYLVSGAPDWIKTEKFDVEAKVSPNIIPKGLSDRARNDYVRRMMQTMLAERFKAVVHREVKEMPVYELVVAKNGPKLTRALDRDCSDGKRCHMWGPGNPSMQGGFPGTSVDMDDLIDILQMWLDHPAINKTNIHGMFDIHIQFNPRPAAQPSGERAPGEPNNADPASLPDLFTALQEQLGLKLEPRKGQVETIVIDHVERPTAN